jgi:hypothetical protein
VKRIEAVLPGLTVSFIHLHHFSTIFNASCILSKKIVNGFSIHQNDKVICLANSEKARIVKKF